MVIEKTIQIIPAQIGQYAYYGIRNENQCEDTRISKEIVCWALVEFKDSEINIICSTKIEAMVIDDNDDCVFAKSIPDFSGYSI